MIISSAPERSHQLVIDPAFDPESLRRRLRPSLGVICGHRRRRGPFTTAGTLLSRIGRRLIAEQPDLAQAHDIEILTAAPDLGRVLEFRRRTLTSQADPQTRTRYYPHDRVRWIGNGLTDLLLARVDHWGTPQSLVVTDVDELDQTDVVWLAGLLRRADPARLRLTLVGATDRLADELAAATAKDAVQVEPVVWGRTDPAAGSPVEPGARTDGALEAARRYVRGDCLSTDPAQRRAYAGLPDPDRRRLHDQRAAELGDDVRWQLGATVFHAQQGGDPDGAGVLATESAQQTALLRGCYRAVVEHGAWLRGRLDWAGVPERRWLATVKMTIAHQAMAEPDQAMDLFDEACAATTLPSVHMQAAYGRAMVFTRYYEPERQDLRRARGLINTAIALAQLSSDDQRRAYNRTFNENGLALVDMRLGRTDDAVRAIENGIHRLETEVDGGRYLLHRSVLRYNRAQLTVRTGTLAEALGEYARLIEEDPHHPDYYFDRAGLWERAGEPERAIADYTRAVEVAPPYPEPYYNRAELRLALGDPAGALADYTRVLDLDPDFVDAYLNRAALRLDVDEPSVTEVELARDDLDTALGLAPRDPRLLCLQGTARRLLGDPVGARESLQDAVAIDPELAEAWAELGALHHELGDHGAAVAALNRSLELADNPDVAENLALLQSLEPVPAR